jgi:hypothetical protein
VAAGGFADGSSTGDHGRNVLNSPRAVQMSIFVVRAFVGFRHVFQSNAELAKKLDKLEAKYDAKFEAVFEAIRELMRPATVPKKRIGFRPHA